MTLLKNTKWTRARALRVLLLAPVAAVVAACTGNDDSTVGQETSAQTPASGSGQAASTSSAPTAAARASGQQSAPTSTPVTQVLQPTPACGDDDDEPTRAQTEGPYFTPNSPERNSLLEAGIGGTPLTVTGFVLSTDCQPIPGALVDFWQCDDKGVYDNTGYRLRGHQFTDAEGRYTLETILPGVYTGRTRHIHVKVQAPNQPVLTTQQYFPNEPGNARDGIYHPDLVMDIQDTDTGKLGTFNYVLKLS
jgi:protocatechuate 3,4-dioxygenase beta subunit